MDPLLPHLQVSDGSESEAPCRRHAIVLASMTLLLISESEAPIRRRWQSFATTQKLRGPTVARSIKMLMNLDLRLYPNCAT